MNSPLPLDPSLPEPLARREFLRMLATAGAATLSMGAPRLLAESEKLVQPAATADSVILIWLAGGMAAPETFDPKRYAPFEKGLSYDRVLSTFPAIPTSVDGVRICEGLENIAQVMDRGTLIRSAVQPDLGSILHSRHQFHWHTGYVPPQTVACPHIGAWMARVLGPRNPVMPAFINIGQRLEGVGESEELKAFTTAGFFGGEYGPMNLPFPEEAAAAVRPPKGMDAGRFVNRDREFRRREPGSAEPRPTGSARGSPRARRDTSGPGAPRDRCRGGSRACGRRDSSPRDCPDGQCPCAWSSPSCGGPGRSARSPA